MAIHAISQDSYTATWNTQLNEVTLRGELHLSDTTEYAPIAQLLENGLGAGPVVVDLRGLNFLNSSGISMLMRLAIKARDSKGALLLRGSKKVPWQGKSLFNLRRICSAIQIELE